MPLGGNPGFLTPACRFWAVWAAVAVAVLACGITTTRGFESESSRDMETVLPACGDRSILLPGVLERDPSWVIPARDGVRVPAVDPAIDEGVGVGMRSVLRRWAEVDSPAWNDCDMSCSSPVVVREIAMVGEEGERRKIERYC